MQATILLIKLYITSECCLRKAVSNLYSGLFAKDKSINGVSGPKNSVLHFTNLLKPLYLSLVRKYFCTFMSLEIYWHVNCCNMSLFIYSYTSFIAHISFVLCTQAWISVERSLHVNIKSICKCLPLVVSLLLTCCVWAVLIDKRPTWRISLSSSNNVNHKQWPAQHLVPQ